MDTIAVGVIRRPHGVRGFVRVHSFSGEVRHLLRLKKIFLRKGEKTQEFTVEARGEAGGDVLFKLQGLDSREEARGLSGWEIRVPREEAAPLEEGEFYFADLCRCELVFQGQSRGKITSVLETGPATLLEVRGPDGKTFMIPFVQEHVGEVDIQAGTVELKTEWLLP